MLDIQASMQARLKRIRLVGNRHESARADAITDHESMAAALCAGNGNQLGNLLALHTARAWDRVKDTI